MSEPTRKSGTLLLRIARLVIGLAVAAGVVYTVAKAVAEIRQGGLSLAEIRLPWIAAAGIAYLVGIAPCWLFWHQTLRAMGQRPTLRESFRAYYISHLGKYVPGKAMVVVLRAGAVRSGRTDTTVAAVSVFVETLTMMAVGAFTAAAILCICYRSNHVLLALGPVLMLIAGVPTLPPVARRLVRFLQLRRASAQIDEALAGLSLRLMLQGWMAIAAGWWLLGTSLFLVLRALPGVQARLDQLPLLTACLALAIVAGFVSMIPGGLGVRELVITPILVGALGYGVDIALVSAVVLRLAWLLSEVSILVILYIGARLRGDSTASQNRST